MVDSKVLYICCMLTDTTNEKILTEKLSKGDHEAYRELFMRYYPKLRFFVLGLLKSEDESEDLTQDIFIKIWTNHKRFNEVNNFGAYLYILAKNTTLNYIESRQIHMDRLDDRRRGDEEVSAPLKELLAKDLQLLVDMVVDSMPSQRRMIYRLSREVGLSNAEIADQFQLNKNIVEDHLNLALKELRDAIL